MEDKLSFDEIDNIVTTHLTKSNEIREQVSELDINSDQKRILSRNILKLHNELTAVFLKEDRKVITQKLNTLLQYLEKIKVYLDNLSYDNFLKVEFIETQNKKNTIYLKNLTASIDLLHNCLKEQLKEINNSTYNEKLLNGTDKIINHWISVLKENMESLLYITQNGYKLKNILGQVDVANGAYKNLLKLYFSSIMDKDLKLQKRFPVLDKIPTIEDLEIESKIIMVDYYYLINTRPELKIDSELEKLKPGFQEMRELYYYLIDKVYLDD